MPELLCFQRFICSETKLIQKKKGNVWNINLSMFINLFYFSISILFMKENHKYQSIICKIHRSKMSENAIKENNHIFPRLLCSLRKNRLLINVRKKIIRQSVCIEKTTSFFTTTTIKIFTDYKYLGFKTHWSSDSSVIVSVQKEKYVSWF